MNYKEAFRYQNFLKDTIFSISTLLNDPSFILRCTEFHHRSAACSSAVDEEIEDTNQSRHNEVKNTGNILKLLEAVLAEQSGLSMAISAAKKNAPIMTDAELEINKVRRSAAQIYHSLCTDHQESVKSTGYDKTFAVDGTQTTYSYPLERTYTRDYDLDHAKQRYKELSAQADKMSAVIEKELICGVVDFSPKWTLHDSIDDMIISLIAE